MTSPQRTSPGSDHPRPTWTARLRKRTQDWFDNDPNHPSRIRRTLVTSALVALALSGALAATNLRAYFSDLTMWFGASFILAIPLWHFNKSLEERKADTVGLRAELSVRDDREPAGHTPTPLDEVEAALQDSQVERLDARTHPIREWIRRGDRDATIAMLRSTIESGLVSSHGLRTPLWETTLHLRFVLVGDTLTIKVEHDSGNERGAVEWTPNLTTLEVFQQLETIVDDAGQHQGTLLFSPAESIRTAGEALLFAVHYSAQKVQSGAEYFDGIIEYVDGWFITEDGIVSREHPYYFINRNRTNDLDWEEHISDKGWPGAHSAMRVARAYYPKTGRTNTTPGSTPSTPTTNDTDHGGEPA